MPFLDAPCFFSYKHVIAGMSNCSKWWPIWKERMLFWRLSRVPPPLPPPSFQGCWLPWPAFTISRSTPTSQLSLPHAICTATSLFSAVGLTPGVCPAFLKLRAWTGAPWRRVLPPPSSPGSTQISSTLLGARRETGSLLL